jgi:SPX domain protein involved in polyphosphate accumulation
MRFEYKFLIPISIFEQIKNEMLPFLTLNDYAALRANEEYTVRSIYFDTLLWKYYFEKIEGIKVRKKLRIRGYNNATDNTIVYLEIKRKNENLTSKNRFPILYTSLTSLFEPGSLDDCLKSYVLNNQDLKDLKSFLYYYINDSLRPTMLITYERKPYYYNFDKELTITFDRNLRYLNSAKISDLFEEESLVWALRNKVIIEVKFTHSYPLWLRDILSKYSLQRLALSKYILCIDSYKKNYPIVRNCRIQFPTNFYL